MLIVNRLQARKVYSFDWRSLLLEQILPDTSNVVVVIYSSWIYNYLCNQCLGEVYSIHIMW